MLKLNRIISTHYADIPFEITLESDNRAKIIDNINYSLKFKVNLFDKKMTKKLSTFDAFFVWTNVVIGENVWNLWINNVPSNQALKKLTYEQLLTINKTFFYKTIENTGGNL